MFEKVSEEMAKIVAMLREDIASVRTSKANPALIENVEVPAYEGAGKLKVKELASITVESANTLQIQPWDSKVTRNLAKALEETNMGLSVTISGKMIRAVMPPLSAERRREYTRLVRKRLEAAKVMIRQVRAEERSRILGQREAGEISKDEAFRQEAKLQELTDDYIDKIDQLGNRKIIELESL